MFFLLFRQAIVPSTKKRETPPTRNRTIDLRMSCFTSVLRCTNWAVVRCRGVLSDRFVWWSDSLWSIHVSSQQRSCLLCAALVVFFSVILHAFSYPMFLFLKSVFSVTRIRFRFYGYLLSILTFALPNWLSPAIYAFCLGIFVRWIEVAWPNSFSSWIRQKTWSAMWAVVTLVFSGLSTGYCSFNKKEKTSADPVSNLEP